MQKKEGYLSVPENDEKKRLVKASGASGAGSDVSVNEYQNFPNAFLCSLSFLGLYVAIYSA